jgi:tRNA pseudouridine synthase 10
LRVLGLVPLPDGALELRILCQHGTYVKEWISSDEGRTTPSLSSLLGVACTCRQLDVEEILTDDVEGPRLPKPAPKEP